MSGWPHPIPPKIDITMILSDLHRAGWVDQKIEVCLSFSNGYLAHLRKSSVQRISLEYAARLHNLWLDECRSERIQTLEETTG